MIEIGFKDNPVDVLEYKLGMETALKDTIDFMEKNKVSIKYTDVEKVTSIAVISSNNDVVLGKMIAEAVLQSGEYGIVNVKESLLKTSTVENIEGFVLDLGIADQQFANNKLTGTFTQEKAMIVLLRGKLTDKQEYFAIVRDAEKYYNRSILIVAQDYSQEVLSLGIYANRITGSTKVCFLRNRLRDNEFDTIYEDIAAFTGAEQIDKYEGLHDVFGEAFDFEIKPGYSIFGKGKTNFHLDHVENLKEAHVFAKSIAKKENLRMRISRFEDPIVTFFVGGNSEVEMKEKKDRVTDSVHSCKAALEEGIIIGGGQLFLRGNYSNDGMKTPDFYDGYLNVFNATMSIFEQICKNCNEDFADISQEICRKKSYNYGYDFKNKKYGDLIALGVVDPFKTVKNALTNAVSLSSTILTTETVIIEE
jgi:chaperonin GroEL